MNKRYLFFQIVGQSLRLGLIAGVGLSVIAGVISALLFGILALGIALLIGVLAGAGLGLFNGVFIGSLTCLWFVPLRDAGRYRQMIGFACVIANIAGLLLAHQYFGAIFVGPVAWWGSQYVCDWYEAENGLRKLSH